MWSFASFLVFSLLVTGCDSALCRNDWVTFGEACYAFIDEYVSWSTANQICQSVRSRLIEVNSRAENEFLSGQLKSRRLSSTWTGIQDFVREGTWVTTSDQQRATYFNWNSRQPDNNNYYEGGEDCVIVYKDGGWDDYWCDDTHHSAVVCESPLEDEVIVG